jgi:hypothetical protein
MALNENTLSKLMYAAYVVPFKSAKTKEEFDAYAKGIVAGLKKGKAIINCIGLGGGPPGIASGIGAIQGGPPALLTLLIANSIGKIPPPVGSITPMQPFWHIAISMTAGYLLTALEVEAKPTSDSQVCIGTGVVTFQIDGDIIKQEIISALEKMVTGDSAQQKVTPMRKQMAEAVGKSVATLMKTATSPILVTEGKQAGKPPPPAADVREGKIY